MRASLICSSLPLIVLAWAAPPVFAGESVKTAPAFVVKTVEGKSLKLADFKGRPVVIDFWATWCKPCRAAMPHLEAVQKLGVSFRIAMADERVLDLYGPVRSIPTTFFINRQGEVVRRVVGYIDEDTLDGYVQELL